MRNRAQQALLDEFFGALCGDGQWQQWVTDRGFAKARDRLAPEALSWLNRTLIEQVDGADLVHRWHGLRVVAADASVLMPAIRSCHTKRRLAGANQRLFSMVLPGADLTLHASVHGPETSERQMLFEALDQLGPNDLLVLDRGYPAAWLVAVLNERGIRYCMRCDNNSGWAALRAFAQSSDDERTVTIKAPDEYDVADYGCSSIAPTVRLVRVVCPNGRVQVMATNLPSATFPVSMFADLYHQRWRIEEVFKRLKHRAKLESVSGLSQHALLVDVAAKILADNITSLLCLEASDRADMPTKQRVCNRSYAAQLMQTVLPRMILAIEQLDGLLQHVIDRLAANYHRRIANRSQPRRHRNKPHPSMAYKA